MTFTTDQYLYIIAAVIIPVISIILIKKKPRKVNINRENPEIISIKETLRRLEDQVEKDHIDIDNLRGKIAFIEGKLSK